MSCFLPTLSFLSHNQTRVICYRPVFFRSKYKLLIDVSLEFIAALKLSFQLSC